MARSSRSLQVIAKEIQKDWEAQGKGDGFTDARPHLQGLKVMHGMNDTYDLYSAKVVIGMFLRAADKWTGPTATKLKGELTRMVEDADNEEAGEDDPAAIGEPEGNA